ncbi:MAG: cytidylate kinase-like family protein [bacterium]|nr:cytidylate kinase-like family protein [bacterium]
MSSNPMARVVERQMRNWELSRSQRLAKPEPKRQEVEDFVCVSRRVATPGAEEVAARLAEALGWPMFDREVLEAMAGDDFVRQQVYANMDQRDLSWTEEVMRGFFDRKFIKTDYFHRLCETLIGLARQGSAVFFGRGADLVLPADRGFRVRLVASHEARIDALAADRDLGRVAAIREIQRLEEERGAFLKRHFKLDPATSARFDLSLHLEQFGVEQAVEVILAARAVRVQAAAEAAAAS